MAHKTFTLDEIKNTVLDQINKIKGIGTKFVLPEASAAYDEATREIGFELPATSDPDVDIKYQWIIERMRRWFIFQLYNQHLLRFDVSDMRAGQLVKNLEKAVKTMDDRFSAARENEATAHIFIKAANVFGDDMVLTSGFLENAMGKDLTHLGNTTKAKRPKQPKATQDAIESIGSDC